MRKIKLSRSLFIIGLIFALLGALVMFEGSIFGDRTTGIATIMGIVGICLIAGNSPCRSKQL